jgi:pimeloyl-ACP methyl ester carboxylesterase
MATQQPSRIEAMIIVSATTHFPDQARTIMRQFSFDALPAEELAQMRQRHRHGDDQIRALFRRGSGFKDSYDDLNFTAADFAKITADTLIVYGDRDPLYPLGIAMDMYSAIPRAYLLVIPNAGHSPIFGKAKDYFVATATAFLRGEWKYPARVLARYSKCRPRPIFGEAKDYFVATATAFLRGEWK